ncbi:MAG: allophanate hydrolase subunit 2 family protein, partial [Mycobacterium sp.]
MTTEFTTQSLRSRPPTLEIMRTGPLALIEDLGRPGLAHLGVTRSGAADRRS